MVNGCRHDALFQLLVINLLSMSRGAGGAEGRGAGSQQTGVPRVLVIPVGFSAGEMMSCSQRQQRQCITHLPT